MRDAAAVWEDVEAALGSTEHVLLWGPPGTGKTWAARSVGLGGRECWALTVTADTSAAELRGHWVPGAEGGGAGCRDCRPPGPSWGSEDGHRARLLEEVAHLSRHTAEVAAGWRFHRGPAVRAWQAGGRLVVDEIGEASGDALTMLQGFGDDAAVAGMVLPSGERVTPAAGFQLVGTTNVDPVRLPGALVDRFLVVEVPTAAPSGAELLPEPLQDPARSMMAADDEAGRVSLRVLLRWVRLTEGFGGDVVRAGRLCFGERARDVLDVLQVAGALQRWMGVAEWRNESAAVGVV